MAPVFPIKMYPRNLLDDLLMMDLHQLFLMPSELKQSPPMLVHTIGQILMQILVLLSKPLADRSRNQVAPLRLKVTAKGSDWVI